jgi:hypothetical protein
MSPIPRLSPSSLPSTFSSLNAREVLDFRVATAHKIVGVRESLNAWDGLLLTFLPIKG